jgi:hypothetical protein
MNTYLFIKKVRWGEEMGHTPQAWWFYPPIFSDLALSLGDVSEYIGFRMMNVCL